MNARHSSLLSHDSGQYWEEYNTASNTVPVGVRYSHDEEMTWVTTYSHSFFANHALSQFLNSNCKNMLQLGASNGKFLKDYQEDGWSVTAYDSSITAIRNLKNRNIPALQVDLNDISISGTSGYTTRLIADISKPTNILMIRILQYLDIDALNLLLFTMIDHAANGSVFFIAGNAPEFKSNREISSDTPRYIASFFGPRTDMAFLVHKKVNADDELLVVRKA